MALVSVRLMSHSIQHLDPGMCTQVSWAAVFCTTWALTIYPYHIWHRGLPSQGFLYRCQLPMLNHGPECPMGNLRNQLTFWVLGCHTVSHCPQYPHCVCHLPASHPTALPVFTWSSVAPGACIHIATAYLIMTPKSKKRGVIHSTCQSEDVRSFLQVGGWSCQREEESCVELAESPMS